MENVLERISRTFLECIGLAGGKARALYGLFRMSKGGPFTILFV